MSYKSKIEISLRELLHALKMEHDHGKPVRRSIYAVQKIRQARELIKEIDLKKKPIKCG